MDFEMWKAGRTYGDVSEASGYDGEIGYIYPDGAGFITDNHATPETLDGIERWNLCIGNQDWNSDDIDELEPRLYDFIAGEMGWR